ncbi:TKL family protein kinase [Trichomonas vaginalis G3]|uniref:TKL family protein kinase n=1 Tax=Trichomonas vaginalis (strain ATCC PRA-98 / G3) TaxID=412133 RepID=A2DZS9_TRIV3|nr:protein kinase protein [Trichomonas vaginalis G3]EAY14147.1 TKL family protein kinase [Trichomonas vaginalis G3]KAI5525157.1 protein kinase protein [Trichomonas vaginalis G3]|eukprot:XP_001326370.1 TKL family protein kinase [Trichomonas vaginalis G3]
MSSPTLLFASRHISNVCKSFENITQTLAAYRNLFVYAIGQFRNFSNHFQSVATNQTLSKRQYNAYKNIITDICKKYLELLQNYQLQNWSKNTLENKISTLPSIMLNLTSSLQEQSSELDPIGAKYFDTASPEWSRLHTLELKSIYSSFESFIKTQNNNNMIVMNALRRMKSISNFFESCNNANNSILNMFSPIPQNCAQYRIEHDNLIENEDIGRGASSVVYSGIYKPTGEEVAIKKFNCHELSLTELQHFQNEITVLASSSHPTLVQLVGATDSYPYCIVTKYIPNGNLFDALHKNNMLSQTDLTIALYDIARGMKCIHSSGFVHRDLKSPNVLIDQNKRIKLCDFGISSSSDKNDQSINRAGTAQWMAPEFFNGRYEITEKVDVYSFAIIAYEIASKQIPFDGLDSQKIITHVAINNLRPHLPASCRR